LADEEYYLRDLVASDWPEFNKMDVEAFEEDDSVREESFQKGLSSSRGLSVVLVHKETKDFIGYYRFLIYGTLAHLQRIGVNPKFQRKGYGSVLMDSALANMKKTGATKYMLYVMQDNEAAIKLYEKYQFNVEFNSSQFEVPFKKLPKKPRGTCRHMDWGEIQLMSLRFGLNPYRIQHYFGSESDHVLIYSVMGQQFGVCRFSPDFPGAFPFVIRDKEYALDFIAHLITFITNKEFKAVKITFDSQTELVKIFEEKKIKLKSKLYRMSRAAELE